MPLTRPRTTTRICPYYRLPQPGNGGTSHAARTNPVCNALSSPQPLGQNVAAQVCRSGAFPTCRRYQRARSTSRRRRTDHGAPSLARKLATSALWVLGIPTAITLAILIAAWITEKVWVPTEQVVIQLAGFPWY